MAQSKSVTTSQGIHTLRDDIRTNNPRLRTIHDLRFRDVFAINSRPTR